MYKRDESNEIISVVIPVYNSEKYIADTLDSVISQDYRHIEIITVDDCSTDKSADIIKQYQQKIPYIKYYRLMKNSGVAIARNKAIEIATGRYIAFLDSDDVWEEGKLVNQLKVFEEHYNIPFTYTALSYIDENGKQIKGKRALIEHVTYKYLLKNTMLATSTIIIDRNVVNEIVFPNRKSAEDYSLWLSLLKNYGDAYGINRAYTRYRKSSTSISSNKVKEVKYFFSVQLEDFHIPRLLVFFNSCCYIVNAVKKHFF